MQESLEWIANEQGQWSATAGSMKRAYERVRWITFGTSITGAFLAALASQAPSQDWRVWLAIAGAVTLAIGGVLTAHFLGPDRASRWARARVVSEALKRTAYEFAVQAAPFDDPTTRKEKLQERVTNIQKDANDLLSDLAPPQPGSTPREPWEPEDYVSGRVEKAAGWYDDAANENQRAVQWLRRIELVLAVITAVVTATIGAVTKDWLKAHFAGFDWAALVAVLTTVSGTVLAHIEASRYDYLVSGYRAAARQLRQAMLSKPEAATSRSLEWSEFVARCEGIIASETGSWVARLGKPTQ